MAEISQAYTHNIHSQLTFIEPLRACVVWCILRQKRNVQNLILGMRTGDSTQNKAPSAKNTTKGNKRELSSPIQQDLQTKKSRLRTDSDSDSIAELNEASTELSDFRADMQVMLVILTV